MTQLKALRLCHSRPFIISVFWTLLFGVQSSFACQLPSDFPENYKEIYKFTKNLQVGSIHGVDECLGMLQQPLKWQLNCDGQGNFVSLEAELFLLPKVTLKFNEEYDFLLENFYFNDWNYSKVDGAELAEVIPRRDKELKIIYTTQSSRKVHLTLVKNAQNQLVTLESLVYVMNIGTPRLEAKFSCFEI